MFKLFLHAYLCSKYHLFVFRKKMVKIFEISQIINCLSILQASIVEKSNKCIWGILIRFCLNTNELRYWSTMLLICNTFMTVTRWCSGRALALQSRGSEFNPQPRHIHFQLIFHNIPTSNIIFFYLQLYQYQTF